MNKLSALLLLTLAGFIQAKNIDFNSSSILSPVIGSTIQTSFPVVMGIVHDDGQKPAKNKRVTILADNKLIAVVATNKNGVWSYSLNAQQRLNPGIHTFQAFVQMTSSYSSWIQGTIFTVASRSLEQSMMTRSGGISSANSAINFPYDGCYINTSTPTIAGSLQDANHAPVANETIHVLINGSTVGTVTSDVNGVFSYTITSAQSLADGSYTVGAHCVQSNVNLTVNGFMVDTVAPAAPVIIDPTQNQVMSSSTVTIDGTAEANSTVTTFVDSDPYGDITYADGSGAWSIDYSLDNATHTVAAQAQDIAGNTGPVCSVRTFSVNA